MIIDELKALHKLFEQKNSLEKRAKQNEEQIAQLQKEADTFISTNVNEYHERKKQFCEQGILSKIGPFFPTISIIVFIIIVICTSMSCLGGIFSFIFLVCPIGTFLLWFSDLIDKMLYPFRMKAYDKKHTNELKKLNLLDKEQHQEKARKKEEEIGSLRLDNTGIQEQIAILSQKIGNDKCVPDIYKSMNCLQTLISYFEQGRADTLKEAFNLYANDLQHQEDLLAQQQFNAQMQAQQAKMQAQLHAQMQAQVQATQQALHNLEATAHAAQEAAKNAEKATQAHSYPSFSPSSQLSAFEIESAMERAIRNSK